jgi:hypothetical protein
MTARHSRLILETGHPGKCLEESPREVRIIPALPLRLPGCVGCVYAGRRSRWARAVAPDRCGDLRRAHVEERGDRSPTAADRVLTLDTLDSLSGPNHFTALPDLLRSSSLREASATFERHWPLHEVATSGATAGATSRAMGKGLPCSSSDCGSYTTIVRSSITRIFRPGSGVSAFFTGLVARRICRVC